MKCTSATSTYNPILVRDEELQFWEKEVRDTIYTINIFSTDESCLVIRDEAHTCCFCIWPHFSDWCGIAVLRERGCEKCTFAASTFYPTLVLGEKLQFWEFVTHTCQLRIWSNLQWCVKNGNSGEVTGMAPLIPMTQWRLLGEIVAVHGRWCT